MKRWSAIATALLVIGLAGLRHSHEASGQATGTWITLFDGKTLDNWNRIGDANWRIEDGAIVADKKTGEPNGFLVTKNSYKDFEILAEFWADTAANSGIFIRCADPQKITATNSYEVNIFDTRPDPSYGTGAIVNFAKVDPMPKAGGKWNTFEITAKGPHLVVVLNGTKTVDIQESKFASGPFALQYAAGVVKFRKVQIKPL